MHKEVLLVALVSSLSLLKAEYENNVFHMLYKYSLIPHNTELRRRVLTTICCNDCMHLPKVENAGLVFKTQDNKEYQLMHNGIKVIKDCYYGQWMTTLIGLLQGHHEPQEEKAFHEVLKYMPSNAVMVELGSYWGFYSLWFQKEVANAQTFLIEPDPKNIEIGKLNFQLNNMQGYFTQAMLAQKSMKEAIFTDWNYNEHIVPVVCVDDFADEHDIKFIHILHSDIQGAEVEMLKGCSRLIAQKRIGYFFISTHRGVHEECLKLLQHAGLEILVSITRQESFSADGLIVAKLSEIQGPEHLKVSKRTDRFCVLVDEIMHE